MRVLLAEDERELATWLVRALAQSDCQVDWVDDGRLVRRSLKTTRYDALILDLGHGRGVACSLNAVILRSSACDLRLKLRISVTNI